MHHLSTSFVLGYHGCDREVGESLLAGKSAFKASDNDYDWLGPGVYFWESNPERALEFAVEKKNRRERISVPFVVGAVIDLGLCLDLTTKSSIENMRKSYKSLSETMDRLGQSMPVNGDGDRKWQRRLDCAVINWLHRINGGQIDSVRGIITEGKPIYPGTELLEKTHVQIAVVNLDCIKAVFRIPKN